MEIEFSTHAVEQLKRRKIPRSKVFATVKIPDRKLPSPRGRELFQKRFGDKVLEVVVVQEGAALVVITAYYLYEIKL